MNLYVKDESQTLKSNYLINPNISLAVVAIPQSVSADVPLHIINYIFIGKIFAIEFSQDIDNKLGHCPLMALFVFKYCLD